VKVIEPQSCHRALKLRILVASPTGKQRSVAAAAAGRAAAAAAAALLLLLSTSAKSST
jgi:hypothetical protein